MSGLKKSLTGKQPPTQAHPLTAPINPGTKNSPVLKGAKAVHVGPGMSWFNLTRKDVEEKMRTYRQPEATTDHVSLWRRLANAFGKLRKSS